MTMKPPSRTSRQTRAPSPALSVRSRRSVTSQRRAPPAPRDVTDDEDSDDELEQGRFKNRRDFTSRRGRKMSVQSNFEFPLDNDSDKGISRGGAAGRFAKSSTKTHRGGSAARSVHEYPVSSRRERTPDSLPSSDEHHQDRNVRRKPILSEMAVQTYGEIGPKPRQEQTHVKEPTPVKKEPTPIKEVQQATKGNVQSMQMPEIDLSKDWECKHCTYINKASERICGVCCKTREVLLKESPPPEFPTRPGDFNFDEIGLSFIFFHMKINSLKL